MPARLQQHVDQRAIVDPHGEDLRGHAALVQRAPLVDLVAHHVEQRVLLDALDQLLLVIEREVGRDRARQLPRPLGSVDERHAASLTYLRDYSGIRPPRLSTGSGDVTRMPMRPSGVTYTISPSTCSGSWP